SSPDGLARMPVAEGEDVEDEAMPVDRLAAERALAGRALTERALVWDETDPDTPSIAFPILEAGAVVAIAVLTADVAFERHEMIANMVGQVSAQLSRVAERERISAELAHARDAALEASLHKSEFLAMMSHEIRTPLNGVIGLNELLLSSGLNAEQRRYAEGVQQSGRALLATINDILDFSKIEAGQLQLESLEFMVRQVVDDAVRLSAPGVVEKDLELIVTVDPDVPETLRGDPTRLTQVLTNLTSNAVKFTETGQVTVTVAAHHDGGEVVLEFAVEDTGVGIDPAVRAVLFEPFVQADLSTTRRHGGTGLGLAIARQIVQALGGEIGVDGAPGGGSRYWFTARFAPTDTVPGVTELEVTGLADPVVGMRVLVLDDNPATREQLDDLLSGWGLRVQTASDYDEARRLLQEAAVAGRPPHAVLADTVMPGDDGLRLVSRLAREPSCSRTGVVLLASGPGDDYAAALPLAAREAPVVVKPVGRSDLLAVLHRVLGPAAVPAAPPAPDVEPRGTRGHILVVEDHEINQLVAVGMLESLGYRTDVAADGATGVARAAERDYDAILMDVQMPGMDGLTATRRIRESEGPRSRMPIIAMTAGAIDGDRDRALAAGMDDFLSKPVSVHALGAMLERWLEPSDTVEAPDDVPPEPPDESEAPMILDPDRLNELDELSSGEGVSYVDLVIERFLGRGSEPGEELAAAVHAGDHLQVRALAHRLKGNSANLGLVELAALAAHIEQLGAAEEPATEVVSGLGAAFDRATQALTGWRDTRRHRVT
ncbi:response regulator, partial [Nocardioides sp.]|uniref:response regulator n=1 Tax=Nocardioides sp. TaxID=35761 RepID=UPI002736BE66